MYIYFKGREFSVEYNENGDIKRHNTKIAFKSMMQNGFIKSLMEIYKRKIWISIEE